MKEFKVMFKVMWYRLFWKQYKENTTKAEIGDLIMVFNKATKKKNIGIVAGVGRNTISAQIEKELILTLFVHEYQIIHKNYLKLP